MNTQETRAPVYINGRFLGKKISGTERFAREILRELDHVLSTRENSPTVTLVAPKGTPPLEWLSRIGFETVGKRQGHAWEQFDLPRAARGGMLLNLCNAGPILHGHQLTIIHDAIVYRHPENYSFSYGSFHRVLGRLLGLRSHIGTVSDFSRLELAQVLHIAKNAITVYPNGYEHILRQSASPEILDGLGLGTRFFFLFVGSPAANKNLERAIKAFASLNKPDIAFVIVGAAQANIFSGNQLAKPANVIMPGRLTDGEVVALYRHAGALVFPSIYEGFGIPPLEAMTLGCPVLAANIASVVEVCGDAALYFDPFDEDAIAKRMAEILEQPLLRSQLIEKGSQRYRRFSWAKSAEKLCHAVGL